VVNGIKLQESDTFYLCDCIVLLLREKIWVYKLKEKILVYKLREKIWVYKLREKIWVYKLREKIWVYKSREKIWVYKLREKIWVYKTSLIPSLIIDEPVPSQESERSCKMCGRGIDCPC
jgi:hypothetical protein